MTVSAIVKSRFIFVVIPATEMCHTFFRIYNCLTTYIQRCFSNIGPFLNGKLSSADENLERKIICIIFLLKLLFIPYSCGIHITTGFCSITLSLRPTLVYVHSIYEELFVQ